MKAPRFWWQSAPTFLSRALSPVAWTYQKLSILDRSSQKTIDPGVPVICIGNLVLGGAGKTPVTAFLASHLKKSHILSRGYGRKSTQTKRVDSRHHVSQDVGDEPLLLSQFAPVWVGKNRPELAKLACKAEARILLLDDGFQNKTLKKTLNLLVVDGIRGFGNQKTFPAGPLREPLLPGLKRADALILMGEDHHALQEKFKNKVPFFRAHFEPVKKDLEQLKEKPTFAFAGIAAPEKFFSMLKNLGIDLIETASFGDHHPYSTQELQELHRQAHSKNAVLITTEKDWWRLSPEWRTKVRPIRGQAVFQEPEKFIDFVKQKCCIK